MDITGKIALVTGASSGMGAAIAKSLAHAGAQIMLLARREEQLKSVAAEIQAAGGKARVYPVDLANSEALASVARPTSLSTMPARGSGSSSKKQVLRKRGR